MDGESEVEVEIEELLGVVESTCALNMPLLRAPFGVKAGLEFNGTARCRNTVARLKCALS